MQKLLVIPFLFIAACAGQQKTDTAPEITKTVKIGPLVITHPPDTMKVSKSFPTIAWRIEVNRHGSRSRGPEDVQNWTRVITHREHGWSVNVMVEPANDVARTSAGFSCLPKVVPEDCEKGSMMVSDGKTKYEWQTCRSDVDVCYYEGDTVIHERSRGPFVFEHDTGTAWFELGFSDGRPYEVRISLSVLPKYRSEALAYVYGLIAEIQQAKP